MKQMKNSEFQKRVKDLRTKKGFSQEELSDKTGLSLRTIQRIENGESVPRGDTLKRMSVALQVSPDEIIDWKVIEDNNVLTVLNLSQLSFIAFPLLGIILPLIIWIMKKDKVKNVDSFGKSILNFQISWTLLLFLYYLLFMVFMIFRINIISFSWLSNLLIIGGLYCFNLILILINAIKLIRKQKVINLPSIRLLS